MPENDIRNNKFMTADDNFMLNAQNYARAYREVGMLTRREYRSAMKAENVGEVIRIISDVPEMSDAIRLKFCKSVVGEDTENFNGATPVILAYAYIATRDDDSDMFRALAQKIDAMSIKFAQDGALLDENSDKRLPVIADLYEGFKLALESRIADLDETRDADKIAQMKSNIAQLDAGINEYDNTWGLNKLRPEDAERLNGRWNELNGTLNKIELSEENKEEIAKIKFLDSEDNELNQFLDDGSLDPEGRAAALLDLTRGNIARAHVGRVDEEINAEELNLELNTDFINQLHLAVQEGVISDADYNEILNENANATAGWVARVKTKLGTAANKVYGFFGRVFRKNQDVDRLKNVRMAPELVSVRQRSIDLSKRILTGFLSGLVASALITTITTAVAATAGISMAASVAAIGATTAIGIGVVQVVRWHRRQQEAGLPTDLHAFLADRRLLASLGISAFAVAAMLFGAAGMTAVATTLGYTALGLGATKNVAEAYRDARRSYRDDGRRMSVLAASAWSVASAIAVVGGGMLGRYLANMGINAYNGAHPKNTVSQNENTRTEAYETTKEVEHSRTVTEYPSDAVPRAESRVQAWYQDNPDLLQQRIDAIEQYNIEHGTDINPYRALNVIGLAGEQTPDNMMLHVNGGGAIPSHGHHGVYTGSQWQNTYGYTPEQINLVAHTFNPDGTINSEAMEIVRDLDLHHLGVGGTVGVVDGGRGAHTDGVLPQNDVARGAEASANGRVHSVYAPTGELPTQHTETWTETQTETAYRDVTDYTRAHGDGMAAFGNYNPRERKTTPRSRIGAWWDTKRDNDRVTPHSPRDNGDDVHDVTPDAEPFNTENSDVISMDTPKDNDKPLDFDEIFMTPFDTDEHKSDTENPDVVPADAPKDNDKPADEYFVLDPENTPILKPIIEPEITPEPVDKGILAITRSQAKSWHDLHERLEKTEDKLSKSPHGSKAAKLHAERSKLQYFINKLRNDLGHYDDATIERAAREALLREDLNAKQALIDAAPAANAPRWQQSDWQHQVSELDKKINKKIQDWGAEIQSNAMADKSELVYPTPISGVQRQKKDARGDVKLPSENDLRPTEPITPIVYEQPDEIISAPRENSEISRREARRQRRAEEKAVKRQKWREAIASLPQKIERFNLFETLKRARDKAKRNDWPGREYFVPESLERLSENNNLTTEPIAFIGDAPVHLVSLGKNDFPVTQNCDVPLVVVDVKNGDDNIKIPFYLETGLDGASKRPTGHWYPVSRLHADGKTYSASDFASDELDEIAASLDAKIGDIRNYIDQELTARRELAGGIGFVGGADAVQHVEPESVMKMVRDSINAATGEELFNSNLAVNGYSMYTAVDCERMLRHLSNIKENVKRRASRFFDIFRHGDERA